MPRRRPIETAPRNGATVLIWIAAQPEPIAALWSSRFHGWLRDDDLRTVLHGVTGWSHPVATEAE